ncbi:MAG TPA: hypothetical protein VK509_12680 [Polyangiales bacterium]|nr:hypothetical protein [Polyangiales bacterium]
MTRLTRILCAAALLGLGTVQGCDSAGEAKVQVEKLPEVKPSLPAVPTLPPPPYATQYADQSYSIYGMRRQLRKTIDTDVTATGYIAKVYVPPECPPKQQCPLPPAPHIWISDAQGEQDETKLLIVAGYAENQASIDEAIKNAKKGKKPTEEELKEQTDMGILPIPVDFFAGAKIKVKGRFAYVSGSGFQSSEGVLEYRGHETLEPAPEAAAAK